MRRSVVVLALGGAALTIAGLVARSSLAADARKDARAMEHYINLTQGKVVDLAPDYGAANSMYVLIALGAALLVAAVIVQLVTRR